MIIVICVHCHRSNSITRFLATKSAWLLLVAATVLLIVSVQLRVWFYGTHWQFYFHFQDFLLTWKVVMKSSNFELFQTFKKLLILTNHLRSIPHDFWKKYFNKRWNIKMKNKLSFYPAFIHPITSQRLRDLSLRPWGLLILVWLIGKLQGFETFLGDKVPWRDSSGLANLPGQPHVNQ